MKNVRENLVDYVTADGERVEARLVRLGRFVAVFEVVSGFRPLRTSQVLPAFDRIESEFKIVFADVSITNNSPPFRSLIEFLLDGLPVYRQNRFMASRCSKQSGAAAQSVIGAIRANLPDRVHKPNTEALVRRSSGMHTLVSCGLDRPGVQENWPRMWFRGVSQLQIVRFSNAINTINEWRRKSLWRDFAVSAAQGWEQKTSCWTERTGAIYG